MQQLNAAAGTNCNGGTSDSPRYKDVTEVVPNSPRFHKMAAQRNVFSHRKKIQKMTKSYATSGNFFLFIPSPFQEV